MSPPRRRRRGAFTALPYILPALLMYLTFIGLPVLHSVYLSFFEWDGLTTATFVGAKNLLRIFSDPLLLISLRNSVVLLLFFTVLPISLALLVVAVIGPKPRPGLTALRAIYFTPQVIPLLAIGIMWRWMYNTDGPIASIAPLLGLSTPGHGLLGDFSTALIALGLVGTWALYGVCLTLFLTGVQTIDPSLYEAVAIDGGGPVWSFFAVTLPNLRREVALSASITGIAALASFDLVYIMTRGGPGNETTVPGLLVYRLGFTNGMVGAASALAVALTVITACYVLFVNWLNKGADQ